MANNNLELERHSIYLSRHVWGELKLHAFTEGRTASEVVNDVVRDFLDQTPDEIQLPGHRTHNPDERRLGRSVHFEPDLWEKLQTLADREKFSIAALIEDLLIDILGLAEDVETMEIPGELDPDRFVKVGNDTYVLDKDPKIIDMGTGSPVQKSSNKDS